MEDNKIHGLSYDNNMFETDTNNMEMKNVVEDVKVEKKKKIVVPVSEMDPETVCGFGPFRPQWIQSWATPRTYLLFYSIVGIIQGSYFTYLVGSISTLEKRYAFKSKVSGTILMLDEISPLLLGVLVGYFGGRSNRPRLVGYGMMLSVACCFLSALPYFMYGPSRQFDIGGKNETDTQFCTINKEDTCDEDDRPPTITVVCLLLFGNFLKGFGNIAFYAVGMAFMDDTGKKKNMPLYFSIAESFRMFGPTLGFLLSSACLKFYEHPFENPGYGPDDPRWIGAWWIGFVLQGVSLFIFSIPILLFPRRLPGQRERAFSNTANFDQENLKQKMAGLGQAVLRLLKNPVYMLLLLANIFYINGEFGYYVYMPKYMESQFRLSSATANLISGPPGIAAIQVFTIIGGIIIWKLTPNARQLTIGMAVTNGIGAIGVILLMIPTCTPVNMVGSTLTENGLDLQNTCNLDCACKTSIYTPVCGPDGISTFFSPCHAGCTGPNETKAEVFYNCSCVDGIEGNYTSPGTVRKGYCLDEDCWAKAIAYVSIVPVISAVIAIWGASHYIMHLRCVDPQDRSIGLGMFESLLASCALIPAPVMYGAILDSTCLVWEESCGESGNCWIYDTEKFNYLLHCVVISFMAAGVLCYTIMIFLSHRVKNIYADNEEIT